MKKLEENQKENCGIEMKKEDMSVNNIEEKNKENGNKIDVN